MDLIFVLVALGFGLTLALPDTAPPPAIIEAPAVAEAVVPDPPTEAAPPATSEFIAEDQTPTGKYTTAAEVRMILDATKGSWVAVREYEGQDLIYFTHLLAWRCGLHQFSYAINDGPAQVFAAEPCYLDTAQPNAINADQVLPYVEAPLGSVEKITISLIYDDLGEDSEIFARDTILLQ